MHRQVDPGLNQSHFSEVKRGVAPGLGQEGALCCTGSLRHPDEGSIWSTCFQEHPGLLSQSAGREGERVQVVGSPWTRAGGIPTRSHTFHWPELADMTVPNSRGCWEV